MPTSTSFPSGHSESAAAFAIAVGDVIPGLRLPLQAGAAIVAFSRISTGVHYPVDIIMGAVVGGLVGRVTSRVARRVGPALPRSGWSAAVRRRAVDRRRSDSVRVPGADPR
jgi:undecaprenyl-diphosphatase